MNNLHKEFRLFSWQHFSTQRGVVKISLQAVSFYAMTYFRVYEKNYMVKFTIVILGEYPYPFISWCTNLVLSCLRHSGPLLKACICNTFCTEISEFRSFIGVYWSPTTNWTCWQVLLGSLHDQSSHRFNGLIKREKISSDLTGLIVGKRSISLFLFFGEKKNKFYVQSESESLSVVSDFVTPWPVACWAPLSMEFSRPDYWSG